MTVRVHVRAVAVATLGVAALTLAGCNTGRDRVPSVLGDVGSDGAGGFVRSSDTLGTQRRLDVYGGATAPVLPTIGTPGYGK